MKQYYFFLVSCLFSGGAFCIEPTSMIDAVMENCSFNEPQMIKLELIPEFKDCQDWNAIKSVSEFSDQNKSNIKCLLYYESLISLCKEMPITELFDLVIKEPAIMNADEVCDNLLKYENESQVIKKVIKEKQICIYLCEKFVKPKLVSDRTCTESYIFRQYSAKIRPSESPIEESIDQRIPGKRVIENKQFLSDNQTPMNIIESKIKKPISSEATEKKGLINDENVDISSKTNVEQPGSVHPKVGESKPLETNNSVKVSTPSSDVEVNQKPIVDDENLNIHSNPASIVDPVNDQQVPPVNPNLNGQSTAQGQAYQDEDDGAYNADPDKEQKPENTPLETVQDGNDDFEELTQTKFKKPEVSRLSDAFGYDSDINGNSYFFSYFSFTCIVLVIGYVLYHNKQKVLALLVEGRHSRRPQRTRRPNSASYHKLDSNLEEAISSSVSKNPSHVIY